MPTSPLSATLTIADNECHTHRYAESMCELSNTELEVELSTLSSQMDAATHRQLVLIREVDKRCLWYKQGAKNCAHWLSWRIGMSPATSRDRLRVAHALGGLPLIDAALANGRISYSKVRAMVRVATPKNEASLLNMALYSTASQLERICRGVRLVQQGQGEATPQRFVSSQSMQDGTIQIQARLNADEATLVLQTIAQVKSALNREREQGTPAASRADALVRLVQRFAAQSEQLGDEELSAVRTGADQAQVVVHLEASQLEEGALDATLEDGTHVSAETLRRVSCDCSMVTITQDRRGDPLDVGRKTRRIHPALRRAVQSRDKGVCRFPGCSCSRFIDVHHIEHWLHGGETKLDNLISLCPAHHQLIHEGGFTVAIENGAPVFRTPNKTTLPAAPQPPRDVSAETSRRRLREIGSKRRIGPRTGLTGWDGRPPQYDRCVQAAL